MWTLAFKAVWGFLRGIPWQVWAAIAVAGVLWWGVNAIDNRGYERGKAEGEAAMEAFKAQIEADRQQAQTEARQREAEHRAAMDAIAAQYEQEKRDAQAAADAVVADLRAGTVRLREHWRGCESAKARMPAATGTPSSPDADADLRRQGAGALVSIGDECDATIRGLQALIRGVRP